MANENAKTQVLYFSANANGEAEKVTIHLSASANARIKSFEYDFAKLAIKGKTASGNQITKYPVKRVDLKEKGGSTLGGVNIWWDDMTGRLNGDEKGQYLGDFNGEDRILVVYNDGSYEITNYELINRYEPNEVYLIQKFYEQLPLQVVYFDGKSKQYYVKRFLVETSTLEKKFLFISEEKGSKLIECSLAEPMLISLTTTNKKGEALSQEINISEFMDVKGWKAVGNRLTTDTVKKITLVSEKYGKYETAEETVEIDDSEDSDDENPTNGGNTSSNSDASTTDESRQTAKRIEPIVPPESNGPQLNLL